MQSLRAMDALHIQNLVVAYCLATDNKQGFMNCWAGPEAFEGYDSGAMGSMRSW